MADADRVGVADAQRTTDESAVRLAAERIDESVAALARLREDGHARQLAEIAGIITRAIARGRKLIVFGNGGSAADAQHIAAELLGRFVIERNPYPAISLSDNTSTVTAIANDYGVEQVFSRQIRGFGQPGDVALAISTSGESENILAAVAAARELGIVTVGLTGGDGGRLRDAVHHCILAPAHGTPRIQEAHTLIGHVLCEIVERELVEGRDGG